jgi:DNA polymerase-3 subunit beta
MKFTIEKSSLVTGLQRIQGIVQARTTMPILSNVRLETVKGGIQLFATDLEIGLRDLLPAEIEADGTITVSAKKLFEISRELKQDAIRIASEDGAGILIRSGKSNFRLRGLPAEEFPSFPEIEETGRTAVPAAMLLEMIRKTAYAVSTDLTRMSLNGVLIHLSEEKGAPIKMVATDGHRLSLVSRNLPAPPSGGKSRKVIVPRKAISELKKYMEEAERGDVEIVFSQNHVVFREKNYTLLSRLIDGKFPNYSDIIPKHNPHQLNVDREMLQGAVRRVSILSDEKTHAIKLALRKGEIQISSNHPEIGEAQEALSAEYQGEDLEVGFNVRYLQDVASAVNGAEIRMLFMDALSPSRIEDPQDDGFLAIIMPMRL